MKFLHTADIHVDSPLVGLQRYAGAPVDEIRHATRRALQNIVELAQWEGVDFVLCAGDIFDGDWKDYNTGLFFAREMSKLRDASIPVFIIAGNHDAASQISRSLRMPENVHILSTKHPETILLNDIGAAIHGQGFSTRAITHDLTASYPTPQLGFFNIGLLHTSVDGRQGHEPYAPCSRDALLARGYDYWALGHSHKHEILHRDPWIVFPGNPQGRHIRESGTKGCVVITVENNRVESLAFHETDVMRWDSLMVDVSNTVTVDGLLDQVNEKLKTLSSSDDLQHPLALRIEITGTDRIQDRLESRREWWMHEIRNMTSDISGGHIWVEKIQVHLQPSTNPNDINTEGLASLLQSIATTPIDDGFLDLVQAETKDLITKLPAEIRNGGEGADLFGTAHLTPLINEARRLLLERLNMEGETR